MHTFQLYFLNKNGDFASDIYIQSETASGSGGLNASLTVNCISFSSVTFPLHAQNVNTEMKFAPAIEKGSE
jgi:hypothetical protein